MTVTRLSAMALDEKLRLNGVLSDPSAAPLIGAPSPRWSPPIGVFLLALTSISVAIYWVVSEIAAWPLRAL